MTKIESILPNKLLNKDKLQLAVFRSSNIIANNNLPINRALAIIGMDHHEI